MQKNQVLDNLKEVEKQLSNYEAFVSAHQKKVQSIKTSGGDTMEAERLLSLYVSSQTRLMAARSRLRAALALFDFYSG